MTSLTAIFGNQPEKTAGESEKLLHLYWNRAGLKKDFAELRNEQFRLRDLVKQKEGSAARVQQKLEHLEHLLLDPEWVYSVVVHFQFRALNLRCRSKLEKFAEQLKQQREQKQYNRALDQWNARRAEEAANIEREIGEQRLQIQMLEDRLQDERSRLASMNSFVRLFRGRSLTDSLDQLAASIHSAQDEETAMLNRYDEIQHREMPGTEGLDVPTKRLINFTIIAFAQQLYLHFEEDDLTTLAREATEKSVGAINYGNRKECEALIARIHKRLDKLENISDFADVLRQRAKLLAGKAKFKNELDAVPVAGSVSTVYAFNKAGTVSERQANLLGENYWGLSEIVAG